MARKWAGPFIRKYMPQEYGAQEQNWAVAQDDRGIIYVGNNVGILEYDGASWRMIRMPNQTVVRSLAKDDHGRIYAGALGEFGYLAPDEHGQMQFVSLLEHVPAENREFADVWRTLVTPEGVYFQSPAVSLSVVRQPAPCLEAADAFLPGRGRRRHAVHRSARNRVDEDGRR